MSGPLHPYNPEPDRLVPLVPPEADPGAWQYDRTGAGHGLRSANLSAAEPIGMLSSNTIRALLVGIVALLGSFGLKWVVSDAQIEAIVQGIGALVTLGSMVAAWYYRVKARKVVEPGASGGKETDSGPDVLAKMIAFLMLGVGVGIVLSGSSGCAALAGKTEMSPLTRIYAARQAYDASLQALNRSIEAGFIPAARVPLIRAVKGEISTGLDQAESFARAGQTSSYKFWIERVEAALTRYLELTQPVAPSSRPTTGPAARATDPEPPEVTWHRQESRYSSSNSQSSAGPSPARTVARSVARSTPPRSRRQLSAPNTSPRLEPTNCSTTLRRVGWRPRRAEPRG